MVKIHIWALANTPARMEASRSHSIVSSSQKVALPSPEKLGSELLWEDLFANPSNWWDNRFDKVTSTHPDFRHKSTRKPLWLNSPYVPPWVHGKLASIDALFQCRDAHFPHEFHCLCCNGSLNIALHLLLDMPHEPTENMYYSLLSACNQENALAHARIAQSHMAQDHLACDGFLGEYLVITLAKCGDIDNALLVFWGLSDRTVFSWTAIITGLTDCGKYQEALNMYYVILEDGVEPNDHTFVSLLKACGTVGDLDHGKFLLGEVLKHNMENNVYVCTSLIEMFGKCGNVDLAQSVFDGLLQRNVVTWTVMLSAQVELDQPERAMQLYEQMPQQGISPDGQAMVMALQACCILAEKEENYMYLGESIKVVALNRGQGVHTEAILKGYDLDGFVGNSLISMYGKCGSITEADCVFAHLPYPNIVSWNAMLYLYVERDLAEKALGAFWQMKKEGMVVDDRTFVSAVQACGMLGEEEEEHSSSGTRQLSKEDAMEIGRALHCEARRKGHVSDPFVCHTLIGMYGKGRSVEEAENAFCEVAIHTLVAWNVMSLAYLKQVEGAKVLQIYKKIHDEGLAINERTVVNALQACSLLSEKEEFHSKRGKAVLLAIGRALHADAQRKGLHLDASVGCHLISMYAKCGGLAEANNVFCRLSQDDTAICNAMVLACLELGEWYGALKLFNGMWENSVTLTDFTLMCVLQACSETGDVGTCKKIHFVVVSAGKDEGLLMENTLIHAYGICSSIPDAQAIFDILPRHDAASWNALIGAYACERDWAAGLHCYEKMRRSGLKPDGFTLTAILFVCSHAGFLEKGMECLNSMSRDYKITLEIAHYSSVVTLLGQAGEHVGVGDVLSSMPMKPDLAMWASLLHVCQKHMQPPSLQ